MATIAAARRLPPRVILGNVAILAVGTVLALILGEVILRAVGLGHPHYSAAEAYRPHPDPRVLFEPRPSFDGFSEGTTVQTNSRGLRERELPLAKPSGVVRLLFLGDSVTFGAGVRAEEAFPRLIEDRLNAAGPAAVETINAGVVGYNTTQELARLETVGLAYEPDVVVLTFVVNDLLDAFSIFDHQYDPSGPFAEQKVWLRRNSHLYRFVQNTYWRAALEIRRWRTGRAEPLRPRARVEERLAEVAAIAQAAGARGATFFLALYPDNLDDGVSPGPSGEQVTVREELTRFAERARYPLLDLSGAIGDVNDLRAREYRLREDPHPSPAGHRAIADALAPALRAVLTNPQSR